MNNIKNTNLARTVVDIIREVGGTILGSQLGLRLNDRLPEWNSAKDFPSLRSMVTTCVPEVTIVKDPSTGDVYSVATSRLNTGWNVFRNPILDGTVLLKPDNSLVAAESELKCGLEDLLVPRLTHEDQRHIMKQFSDAHVAPEMQPQFEASISSQSPDYWKLFVECLKVSGLQKEWVKFRFERQRELLGVRLRDLGCSAEKIHEITTRAIAETKGGRSERERSVAQGVEKKRIASIQDLAMEVLSRLSEEQLGSLQVPLGKVWEAMRVNR
ncbi:hypothetical protein [Roseimicrobium sp. ORNL1]|uniref:hypothetical protein n=1 Tax=Roseimicrobium sp. ORNL1 TaxID=2711231 RepID=UPI0013E1E00E|nr:hypothetical protein [Roseimicrobium sp. ORNL1]QIF03295.1 hypothetical protein G5S37_17780 [Roseimicrobium sp. ORNL1]